MSRIFKSILKKATAHTDDATKKAKQMAKEAKAQEYINQGKDPSAIMRGLDKAADVAVGGIKWTTNSVKNDYETILNVGGIVANSGKKFAKNATVKADTPPGFWPTSDNVFGYKLKPTYAAGLTAAILVGTTGPKVVEGEIAVNNKMNLGKITPDNEGMPNQITQTYSPGVLNQAQQVTPKKTIDNMGADGELALALHYLGRGGGF